MAGVDLPFVAWTVSNGQVEVALHACEVLLRPGEPVASKLVGEHGGAPVRLLGEGARLDVHQLSAPVHGLLALDLVQASAAAHEHDAVGLVVEVVVGLPGLAVRHEQEAVVLEVHLMPIEKRAAPVTEPLVLKQPRTDDVVRRVRDAHGVLTSMRDGVAAAQGEDPVDVAHAIGLAAAGVDAPNAERARLLGTWHEAAAVPHDVAPRPRVPDRGHGGGADPKDGDDLVSSLEVDDDRAVPALSSSVRERGA